MPSHSFISFSFFTLPTSLTSPPFYLFHWQTLKFSCWLKTLVIDVRTRGKGGEMSFSGLWTCLSLSKRFWGTLFNVLGCSHLSGFGVMDLTCFNVTVVLFSHDSLVYLDETVTETWNLLHCVNISELLLGQVSPSWCDSDSDQCVRVSFLCCSTQWHSDNSVLQLHVNSLCLVFSCFHMTMSLSTKSHP